MPNLININKFRIFLIILVAAIIFAGCKKGFIDDVAPTDSATSAQVFASKDAVRAYFNGIYRQMRNQWESIDGSAGGEEETWGYNSIIMTRDVKGKDIVMPYASFYYYDYQNNNREPTYRRPRFVWYFFYELINQVNTLIDGTEKSTTIADEDKTLLIAEARALRALYYFELAREFQFTIAKDPAAPGVPLYTQTTSADSLGGNPRGTIRQTYDQINADIQFAVQHLSADRALKNQVNLNVAWGFAARIYLEQEMWPEAEAAAQNAIEGQELDAEGYTSNYQGLASSEVIWGFYQTQSNGGQSLYYGTPSSFFEQTGAGYDIFWISEELAGYFTATDVRNTFYIYWDEPGAPYHIATNKYGTPTGSPEDIEMLNGNIEPMKTIDFDESLAMMRVGEMYLIRAEAKARQHESDAGDVLFELQENRDPDATPSGNTDEALIDEILIERRKELYGEMGVDFLDAKRLQLPIDRTVTNHAVPDNYLLEANDPAFNLKIPQSEIQANKNISPSDQNP